MRRTRVARCAILAGSGVAAVAAYALADPVCLGGPFARVGAEARAVWLSEVAETRSIVATIKAAPVAGLTFLLFMAAAVMATFAHVRKQRSIAAIVSLLVLIGALLPALVQSKFMPYASFLGCMALAVAIADLGARWSISAPIVRFAATVVTSQVVIVAAVVPLAAWLPTAPGATHSASACLSEPALAPLKSLSPGLIVAAEDLGPVIVLHTPHDALSAPYHRIDGAIVDAIRIFAAPSPEAEMRVRRARVDYVALCVAAPSASSGNGLASRLARGDRVSFLEPVIWDRGPLKVWRVR